MPENPKKRYSGNFGFRAQDLRGSIWPDSLDLGDTDKLAVAAITEVCVGGGEMQKPSVI